MLTFSMTKTFRLKCIGIAVMLYYGDPSAWVHVSCSILKNYITLKCMIMLV